MRFRSLVAVVGATLSVLLACAKPNVDEGSTDPTGKQAGPKDDVTKDDAAVAQPPPDPAVHCDATTCTGCCIGNQCFRDHTVDHCAAGGAECPPACKAAEICSANAKGYVCAPPPPPPLAAKYTIVLVGATVQNGADGAGDLPDVYVNTGAFGKLPIPRTATIDNNLKPIWNLTLGTLPNADVVGAVITAEVKDDDFGADDPIGTCKHTVTLAEVVAGKVIVPKADCLGGVDALELTIKPAP